MGFASRDVMGSVQDSEDHLHASQPLALQRANKHDLRSSVACLKLHQVWA